MTAIIDTSVLVAAVIDREAFHQECQSVVVPGGLLLYQHGIAETFNTLTGGAKSYRLPADDAHSILREDYIPRLEIVVLTPVEMLDALSQCRARGVRGGGIYDFLHLAAAKKAGAERFYTLNTSDFTAFHRRGDPEIVHPRDHGM